MYRCWAHTARFFCLFSKPQVSGLAWAWAWALLLFVSNAYAGQVTLAWDAVSAPSLSGYRLHYGQSSGSYSSQLDAGTQTTYTVSGLTVGQTYYFAVTAYDTDEESAFSNEVSATISSVGVQLSTNPSTVPPGGTVTATWSGITNPTTTDWIGLYMAGAPDTAYIDWIWVSCSKTSGSAQASGSCPFTVPATLAAGSYELRLLANDSYMLLATSNVIISPSLLVAQFSASPTSGQAPLVVTFTDTSSGTRTAWAWDFGDGVGSTIQSPTHTYTTPGTYTVTLTVTGPDGSNTATKTGYITVTAPPVAQPVAAFNASPTSGSAPLAVTFTDASTGSITTWAWNFGNGSTSTLRQPTHTYTTAGTYTVTLTVTGPGGSDTATKTGYITVAPALLEVGDLTVDYVWKRITFRQQFVDPIVVATPLSSNDFAPAVIRLRNVEPTGFEIRVEEWDYLDGAHLPETVSYLAMERGSHTLGTGIRVEAGRMTTNKITSWSTVSFQQGFQVAPVLLTAVTSFNEADAVITRVTGISTSSFQIRLQEQLSKPKKHATESIDYIAWEPSSGTVDGLLFEVNTTANVVSDEVYTLQFTEPFLTPPMFLAGMQTTLGTDPATLRWDDKDQSQVVIQVQEEASTAHNLTHKSEVVGYMAFTYP
jgi:PKD repeat protein